MKKKTRTFVAVLLALFAVALLAVFYVARNLESFVSAAIEAYGSEAAGVPVDVEHVDLQLREGIGTIDRLAVSNPPDFSNEPIFSLGEIRLDLVPSSLTSDLPVIEEVRIQTPVFLYEINAQGKINLNVIRENLRRFASEREKKKSPVDRPSPRLKIERILLDKGKAVFDTSAVGGKRLSAELPPISLTDLGGEDGITPGGLAEIVFSTLLRELEQSAAKRGVEKAIRGRLEEETGRLKENLEEKLGPGAGDFLKKGLNR